MQWRDYVLKICINRENFVSTSCHRFTQLFAKLNFEEGEHFLCMYYICICILPTPLAGGQRKIICGANEFSLAFGQGGGHLIFDVCFDFQCATPRGLIRDTTVSGNARKKTFIFSRGVPLYTSLSHRKLNCSLKWGIAPNGGVTNEPPWDSTMEN